MGTDMPETDKMKCPDCGAEMNHHADKLVYDDAHGEETDEGGRIFESHACPNCGHSATRSAGASD
jgi:ribosomal protein S27AE